MKRVLVWGMTSNWGGIESVLYNYVSNSNKDEIQFDFITTFKTIPRSEELRKLKCNIYFICDRRSNYLKYRKELDSFFKSRIGVYDAVWLNDCMFANIDALKLAKKYGIKKRIIHAHNSNSLGGGKSRIVRHKINSLLLPVYATDYWACSQLAGEWSFSKKILNSNSYKVINNAIDCKEYSFDAAKRKEIRKKLGIKDDVFVIGHIGRFDYQKNHPYLLKIVERFFKVHNNSILLSIGTGTDFEVIKEQAAKMNIQDHVMFLGQRNDADELFQAMDVFLLPSQFEGLPVVLVEAMASGLTCIVSDKVTKEAAIIPDLVVFKSIDGNVDSWVNDMCLAKESGNRRNTLDEMRTAGFDIKTQASTFHELF